MTQEKTNKRKWDKLDFQYDDEHIDFSQLSEENIDHILRRFIENEEFNIDTSLTISEDDNISNIQNNTQQAPSFTGPTTYPSQLNITNSPTSQELILDSETSLQLAKKSDGTQSITTSTMLKDPTTQDESKSVLPTILQIQKAPLSNYFNSSWSTIGNTLQNHQSHLYSKNSWIKNWRFSLEKIKTYKNLHSTQKNLGQNSSYIHQPHKFIKTISQTTMSSQIYQKSVYDFLKTSEKFNIYLAEEVNPLKQRFYYILSLLFVAELHQENLSSNFITQKCQEKFQEQKDLSTTYIGYCLKTLCQYGFLQTDIEFTSFRLKNNYLNTNVLILIKNKREFLNIPALKTLVIHEYLKANSNVSTNEERRSFQI